MTAITLRPAALTDLAAPSPAITAGIAQGFQGHEAGGHTAIAEALTAMTGDAGPDPFGAYWAIQEGVAVGLCSFKHGPQSDPVDDWDEDADGDGQGESRGQVEIAYFTFPDFEGHGVARAMVAALAAIARGQGVGALLANTLPKETASAAVLRRSGFQWLGDAQDPEDGHVWAWRREL